MISKSMFLRNILRSKTWAKIWWHHIPGVTIKVKWPVGEIVVDHNDPRWYDLGGAVWVKFESADPNDHYRLWMEENVGQQGWDWNWDLKDNDVAENCLTIRLRKKHEKQATVIAMQWA